MDFFVVEHIREIACEIDCENALTDYITNAGAAYIQSLFVTQPNRQNIAVL